MTSRVVPREPNEAMIVAGCDAWLDREEGRYAVFAGDMFAVWRAMFDAAPACEPVPDDYLKLIHELECWSENVSRPNNFPTTERLTREAADAIAALRQQNAELREWNAAMVKKAAEGSLDGYRELGSRCAELERERDELRAALQGIAEDTNTDDDTADYLRHLARLAIKDATIAKQGDVEWAKRLRTEMDIDICNAIAKQGEGK